MAQYNLFPSPQPLPPYHFRRSDLERWDTEPLPAGLVFTENALAITDRIITRDAGTQLLEDFHRTGEHVNAPPALLNFLTEQVRATGGWEFMLDPRICSS